MTNFWGKIGEKIYIGGQWCFHNHPGKTIGFLLGILLAVLFIILGFWQTLILIGLSSLGFYGGKCWDEGGLPSWVEKLVHRISYRSKK